MKPGTGAVVGAALGAGYFALVERDRTPTQRDCVYLMPDSTDWLALAASGALLHTGFARGNTTATVVGSAIGAVHVAKLLRKSKVRRGRS